METENKKLHIITCESSDGVEIDIPTCLPTIKEMLGDIDNDTDSEVESLIMLPYESENIMILLRYLNILSKRKDILEQEFMNDLKIAMSQLSIEDKELTNYEYYILFSRDGLYNYLGMEVYCYDIGCKIEDILRQQMYDVKDNEVNEEYLDPYHGLTCLTQEIWESIPNKPEIPVEIIKEIMWEDIGESNKNKRSWKDIQDILSMLKKDNLTYGDDSLFVAGGFMYHVLFNTSTTDIDLFPIIPRGVNDIDVNERSINLTKSFIKSQYYNIISILNYLSVSLSHYISNRKLTYEALNNFTNIIYERTKNVINICINPNNDWNDYDAARLCKKVSIQVILRAYHSPSEVLHGFDVDCCGIGYDGKNIWLTDRALFSLRSGYNTFSFDRMSPSYEWRLAKYGQRGMSLHVPGYDRMKVDTDKLNDFTIRVYEQTYCCSVCGNPKIKLCIHPYFNDYIVEPFCGNNTHQTTMGFNCGCDVTREDTTYLTVYKKAIKELKGINLLIYLEWKGQVYSRNEKMNFYNNMYPTTLKKINKAMETMHVSDYAPKSKNTIMVGRTLARIVYENIKDNVENRYINMIDQFIPDDTMIEEIEDWRRDNPQYGMFNVTIIRSNKLNRLVGKYRSGSNIMFDVPEGVNGNLFIETSDPYYSKKIWIAKSANINMLINIPDDVYYPIYGLREWDFSQGLTFKTINPGEQMTGTFHAIVLEDQSAWWNGIFYQQ